MTTDYDEIDVAHFHAYNYLDTLDDLDGELRVAVSAARDRVGDAKAVLNRNDTFRNETCRTCGHVTLAPWDCEWCGKPIDANDSAVVPFGSGMAHRRCSDAWFCIHEPRLFEEINAA